MKIELQFPVASLHETDSLASRLAAIIRAPMTIALSGSLGTGKTQFVRFLAQHLGVPPLEVTSPTYVLMQRYLGTQTLYHFDFYRLDSVDQVWDLGIDELYEQPVINLIEWADKFPECLPDDHLQIRIEQCGDEARKFWMKGTGNLSQQLVQILASEL